MHSLKPVTIHAHSASFGAGYAGSGASRMPYAWTSFDSTTLWRASSAASSSSAARSSGSRTVDAKVATRTDARPSVCTAMSQIGSDVRRRSASGRRAGQSMTAGLYGLWVSSSMLQNICLCASEPIGTGPRL